MNLSRDSYDSEKLSKFSIGRAQEQSGNRQMLLLMDYKS